MNIEQEVKQLFSTPLDARTRLERFLSIQTFKRPGGSHIAARQERVKNRLARLRSPMISPVKTPGQIAADRLYRCYEVLQSLNINIPYPDVPGKKATRAEIRQCMHAFARQYHQHLTEIRDARLTLRIFGTPLRYQNPIQYVVNPSDGHYTVINGWLVHYHRSVHLDWNRYSKSWHRRYGPAQSVSSWVYVAKENEDLRQIAMKRFSSKAFSEILIELGVAARQEVPNKLKKVQQSPILAVRPIGQVEGVQLFERTLGEDRDYVALYQSKVWCAPTPAEAVNKVIQQVANLLSRF